jgi:hypothetical protein
MSVFEYDAQTGETISREYTAEELAQYETDVSSQAFRQTDFVALAAKRIELLDRLGITEEEAKLLLS